MSINVHEMFEMCDPGYHPKKAINKLKVPLRRFMKRVIEDRVSCQQRRASRIGWEGHGQAECLLRCQVTLPVQGR